MTDKVFVIAEAGVNHNGDSDLAHRLVEAAAEAGADAVKFQTFKADKVVVPEAPKARYQVAATGEAEGQIEMLRKLELDHALHHALAARCSERGLEFMSTAFDTDSLGFLIEEVGLQRVKVPSGEITNGPLLLAMARAGLPIVLSTGMSTLEDVKTALQVLAFGLTGGQDRDASAEAMATALASPKGLAALRDTVTILHCTTEYPAPFEEANLRAMDSLAKAFGLPVGLSDHTPGIAVPIAAVGRGATFIEKHFTLDRSLPGPDHTASLEPDELSQMVTAIRQVERALGSGDKAPTASELGNREIARRSLVATAPIRKGEPFTAENLGALRPGNGRSPNDYWSLLDRPAPRDYALHEMID